MRPASRDETRVSVEGESRMWQLRVVPPPKYESHRICVVSEQAYVKTGNTQALETSVI
jgi:hypothetical protein